MADSQIQPIIFYDGVCGLCSQSVQWILARDTHHKFHFAPLQGDTASRTLGLQEGDPQAWSVVLWDGQRAYRHTAAVVRIMTTLGGGWAVLGCLFWCIPWPVRDAGYRLVARKRYRWFGQAQACQLPTPDTVRRMLP